MDIMTCFAYDEVQLILRNVQGNIAVKLKNDNNMELTMILQPMQCKILGEALFSAAGIIPVNNTCGTMAGSLQVKFELEKDEEELLCQQLDLSVRTDKMYISKTAYILRYALTVHVFADTSCRYQVIK